MSKLSIWKQQKIDQLKKGYSGHSIDNLWADDIYNCGWDTASPAMDFTIIEKRIMSQSPIPNHLTAVETQIKALEAKRNMAQHNSAIQQALTQAAQQAQHMIQGGLSNYPQGIGSNHLNQGGPQNGNWQTNSQIHSGAINAAHNHASIGAAIQAIQSITGLGPIPIAGQSRYDTSKPLENTGIKIGEITAYRMWNVKGDYLESFSRERIWAPDEPMQGVPSDFGDDGIWAFKEKSRALEKMLKSGFCAYGSVHLWGKIVEQTLGYRAEYAKIISLDAINSDRRISKHEEETLLKRLRERYNLKDPNA